MSSKAQQQRDFMLVDLLHDEPTMTTRAPVIDVLVDRGLVHVGSRNSHGEARQLTLTDDGVVAAKRMAQRLGVSPRRLSRTTPEERIRARERYGNVMPGAVVIDDCARADFATEGGVWIQALVWLPNEE